MFSASANGPVLTLFPQLSTRLSLAGGASSLKLSSGVSLPLPSRQPLPSWTVTGARSSPPTSSRLNVTTSVPTRSVSFLERRTPSFLLARTSISTGPDAVVMFLPLLTTPESSIRPSKTHAASPSTKEKFPRLDCTNVYLLCSNVYHVKKYESGPVNGCLPRVLLGGLDAVYLILSTAALSSKVQIDGSYDKLARYRCFSHQITDQREDEQHSGRSRPGLRTCWWGSSPFSVHTTQIRVKYQVKGI